MSGQHAIRRHARAPSRPAAPASAPPPGEMSRIESARRRRHEVGRHRAARLRILLPQARRTSAATRSRSLAEVGPEVGAAGGGRVVALVARGRRARPEVGRIGERLPDQLGADDGPVLVGDEAAVGRAPGTAPAPSPVTTSG